MDRRVPLEGMTVRAKALRVTGFLLGFWLGSAELRAGPIEDAQGALAVGDARRAVELLAPLATSGETRAQVLLGQIHLQGIGLPQNFALAAEWMAKAAAQGDADAQSALGRLYADGLGVAADGKAALEWLSRAAEKGNPEHQHDLALALDTGKAGITDRVAAAQWFARAADQGLAKAKTSLGLAYQSGAGVEKNLPKAAALYAEAAEAGDSRAQNNLGLMLARGEGVPQDYPRAVELFKQALAQGLTQANYNLGVMYENGFGVPQDEAQAMELYRRAGLKGDASASAAVANSGPIFDVRLAPTDLATAKSDDFAAAAHNGDPVAMFLAGYVAAAKESSAAEMAQAAQWFDRAAARGMAAAMANLGLLYVRGLGVPQDFVLGYMWLNIAAASGLPEAVTLRDSVGANMTPAEIADAQKLIEEKWATLRP
jgi:TPR repeat protein